MRESVRALLEEGLSRAEIARRLDVSKGTVGYHIRHLDEPIDERFARRYDWPAIRSAYESGLSVVECQERFGFSKYAWYYAVQRGEIVPRDWVIPMEELLVVGRRTSRGHLKQRLLREGLKENRCERCGITEWRREPLNMALHHINGDKVDNRLENLQLLCPNCHAQTPNYGGRNGHRRPRMPAV
jgi:5-methylcytosine-specific restriction endonuclease McrA